MNLWFFNSNQKKSKSKKPPVRFEVIETAKKAPKQPIKKPKPKTTAPKKVISVSKYELGKLQKSYEKLKQHYDKAIAKSEQLQKDHQTQMEMLNDIHKKQLKVAYIIGSIAAALIITFFVMLMQQRNLAFERARQLADLGGQINGYLNNVTAANNARDKAEKRIGWLEIENNKLKLQIKSLNALNKEEANKQLNKPKAMRVDMRARKSFVKPSKKKYYGRLIYPKLKEERTNLYELDKSMCQVFYRFTREWNGKQISGPRAMLASSKMKKRLNAAMNFCMQNKDNPNKSKFKKVWYYYKRIAAFNKGIARLQRQYETILEVPSRVVRDNEDNFEDIVSDEGSNQSLFDKRKKYSKHSLLNKMVLKNYQIAKRLINASKIKSFQKLLKRNDQYILGLHNALGLELGDREKFVMESENF